LADEILLADRTLVLKGGKIACEIDKNDLLEKAPLLSEMGIKLPTLLKVLLELKNSGFTFNFDDFSIDEFVRCLGDRLK